MIEKSVFDTVIGTLSRSLHFNLEAKINKICEQIEQDSMVIRRNDAEISVQGSLAALVELDTRLKEALKSKESSSFCTSKPLTDQELEDLTSQNTEKSQNRENRLPNLHCHQCSFETKRPNHLKKHLQKHSRNPIIVVCNECDFKCLRSSDLAKHKLRNHCQNDSNPIKNSKAKSKEVNLLECTICNYKTLKSSMMSRHSAKHQLRKPSQAIDTKKDLQKPSKDNTKLNKCSLCGYSTLKASNFARHKRIHTDERTHKCLTCGLSFKRSDTLTNHLATHGTGLKFCDVCGKVCRSQNHLNDHKATHSDLRNFLCHICGMTFKTKATKNMHLRNVHESSQKCLHCGQKVASMQSLSKHLKMFHSDKETLELNDQVEDEDNEDDEPVIYTLNLAQDTDGLENNLQYLINDSGSFIISSNSDLS